MAERHSGYEIELLGFSDPTSDRAASGLSRAFGIPDDKARRLIQKVPVRVAKGIQRPQAEQYVKALLSIGADVRVQGTGAERIYLAEKSTDQEIAWTGAHQAIRPPEPAARSGPVRTAEDQIVCPKCGLKQPLGDTCARCGIVYDKFLMRQTSDQPAVESGPRQAHLSGSYGMADNLAAMGSSSAGASAEAAVDPFVVSPDEDDKLFRQGQQVFDLGQMMRPEDAFAASPFTPGVTAAASRDKDSGPKPATTSASVAIHRPTGRAAEMARGSVDVGFWDKLGEAFTFSVAGQSYQWLALMAGLGLITWLVLYFTSLAPLSLITIMGWFMAYIFFAAFLAAQWRFFGNAFAIAARNKGGAQPPLRELGDFKSEFVLPGEILSLGAAILWSPIIYTIIKAIDSGEPASPVRLALFALLPLIYWPMGMAFVTASGRLTEIFIVTGIVRGMVIGGLEYAFVVVLGIAGFFGVMYLVNLAGHATVYHWALLYLLLGYASGVQGYLLGKLLRRRPKMVEGVEVEEAE